MVQGKSDDNLKVADVSLKLNPNSKELASIALETPRISSILPNKNVSSVLLTNCSLASSHICRI